MVTRPSHSIGMGPISPPTLGDGEIVVRPLRDADVPAIVKACQDPEIPRWTRVPEHYAPEEARQFLAVAATEAAAGMGVALAIAGGSDELLGRIGLRGSCGAAGTREIRCRHGRAGGVRRPAAR